MIGTVTHGLHKGVGSASRCHHNEGRIVVAASDLSQCFVQIVVIRCQKNDGIEGFLRKQSMQLTPIVDEDGFVDAKRVGRASNSVGVMVIYMDADTHKFCPAWLARGSKKLHPQNRISKDSESSARVVNNS